jgi:caffeoyl-CoA O-methyltransferase
VTDALTARSEMMVGRIEGHLLSMLVFALRPRTVLEIGTFTGYSALVMAEQLPPGGHLITCEVDDKHADIAQRHIAASPWSDRIELVRGPALETIARLPGPFDLIFIDADKTGYCNYFTALLPKLSSRGLMLADNVLQFGAVANDRDTGEDIVAMRRFNDLVHADERVEQIVLTVRDGLTVIRRVS